MIELVKSSTLVGAAYLFNVDCSVSFVKEVGDSVAGIELIFFTVASMGLCSGFVLETVLIIPGCFRYC